MKNHNLKEGTIDNSVVTIKRLLNAHPEIDTRNLVLGSRFDSNTTSALVTFQKIKGIKPTGTMTRNSWLVLGNDLISYRGTEYLKNASNNDPILLYMLSGVMILKNTKDRPLPSFDVLWSYHKGNDPTYVDPVTKKAPPGFENQCAINMSYALQKGGVNMSSFKGKTVHITENKVKIYLAADIYQLAKWVIDYFQNDLVENELSSLWATNSVWKEENVLKDHSRDSLNYDQELLKLVKGKRGILILYDFWRNQYNQLRGHIDLWDGYQLKRGINEEILRAKSLVFIPLP